MATDGPIITLTHLTLNAHSPTGKPVEIEGPNTSPTAIAIYPTSTHIAEGASDGTTLLRELPTLRPVATLQAPTSAKVTALIVSCTASLLASGHADGTVVLYDIPNAVQVATFKDTSPILSLSFHHAADPRHLAAQTALAITIFSPTTHRQLARLSLRPPQSRSYGRAPHSPAKLTAAAFSPRHPALLAATDDTGCVTVWDVMKHLAARPRTHTNLPDNSTHAFFTPTMRAPATALVFAPDATLAVAGFDKHVRFYDADLSRFLFAVACPAPISSLAFRESKIVLGLSDGSFTVTNYNSAHKFITIFSRVHLQIPSSAPSLAVRSVLLPLKAASLPPTSRGARKKNLFPRPGSHPNHLSSGKPFPAMRSSSVDKGHAPLSPVLPPPIAFDTSTNFLESIDEMLSGRGVTNADSSLLDAEVFSPVSKRIPPKPSHKGASPISEHTGALLAGHPSEQRLRSKSVQDFTAAGETFLFETTQKFEDDLNSGGGLSDTQNTKDLLHPPTNEFDKSAKTEPHLQDDSFTDDFGQHLKNGAEDYMPYGDVDHSFDLPNFQRRMEAESGSRAHSSRLEQQSPLRSNALERHTPPKEVIIPAVLSAQRSEPSSGFSPDGSVGSRVKMSQNSVDSRSRAEEIAHHSDSGNAVHNDAAFTNGGRTASLKLDDDAIAQLASLFRDSVKAEMDYQMTDLRNDILNIHSEVVVMSSRLSEEMKQVVVERDTTVNRLNEELVKLRTDNERLRRNYGLG